jgi:deoxyribonuclease V
MKFEVGNQDLLITPPSISEAKDIQNRLRSQIRLENDFGKLNLIAGLDVGYDIQNDRAKAAVVTMKVGEFRPIESFVEFMPVEFPYVPGFLSFREAPVIMKALSRLRDKPDILMIDGHGIAHPRRMGIAAHIGVLLDMPTIGVAKSRLCGVYKEPDLIKGSQEPLYDKGEIIGTVLRSRDNVKPLFISPGHRIDLSSAVELVQRCLIRYRLPEPTRLADKLSKISTFDRL